MAHVLNLDFLIMLQERADIMRPASNLGLISPNPLEAVIAPNNF